MSRPKEHRDLTFNTVADIVAEVGRLDGAALRGTNNWTPAQNLEHIARPIAWSIDGWPFAAPIPLRIIGRLIKASTLRKGFGSGISIPKDMARHLIPPDDVTWDEAMSTFRTATNRIFRGERMLYPSPLFGPMTHEAWVRLHCLHCALHLGFIHMDDASASPGMKGAA